MTRTLPPEPPPDASITDAAGHVFVRRADGWACPDCAVCRDGRFGWEKIVRYAVKPWQITLNVPWSESANFLGWVRAVNAYEKNCPRSDRRA